MFIALSPSSFVLHGESMQIKEREITYRTRLFAKCFSRETEMISNPVAWLSIQWVERDGARVEEGDTIILFDPVEKERQILDVTKRLELSRKQLKQELAQIENDRELLEDDLAQAETELNVLKIRETAFKAMPNPEDVSLARERHRVKKLMLESAAEEYERKREAFERQLISPAELQRSEQEWLRAKAEEREAAALAEITALPVSDSTLQILRLRQANKELEIDKLTTEILKSSEVAEVRRRGAEAQFNVLEKRYEEHMEEYENLAVKAPVSGTITYTKDFRNLLAEQGGKIWKRFNMIEIQQLDKSLIFKAALPDRLRSRFEKGDKAVLHISGQDARSLAAEVHSFSGSPRDFAEGENAKFKWGGNRDQFKTGVKVFDVEITPHEGVDELRPGIHAWVEIISSTPVKKAAVPASWIRVRDGQPWLAIDGEYQKVGGEVVGADYVLDDDSLIGKTATLRGEFQEHQQDDDGRLSVVGELTPSDTVLVNPGEVHQRPRIIWLIEEGERVNEGDLLARLDTKEIMERIDQTTDQVESLQSNLEEKEAELESAIREGIANVGRLENLAEIENIQYQVLRDSRDSRAIAGAEKEKTLAEINLKAAEQKSRQIREREGFYSPAEKLDAERGLRRAELSLEEAVIRLQDLLAGPPPNEIEAARIAWEEALFEAKMAKKNAELKQWQIRREMERMRRRLNRFMKRYREYDRQLKNMQEVTAPAAGVVRYRRVWHSGAFVKVRRGALVSTGYPFLEITDTKRMHLEVKVPENCWSRVREGLGVTVRVPSLQNQSFDAEVVGTGFLFGQEVPREGGQGMYSSHEPPGVTWFRVQVDVLESSEVFRPGMSATVLFPFEK